MTPQRLYAYLLFTLFQMCSKGKKRIKLFFPLLHILSFSLYPFLLVFLPTVCSEAQTTVKNTKRKGQDVQVFYAFFYAFKEGSPFKCIEKSIKNLHIWSMVQFSRAKLYHRPKQKGWKLKPLVNTLREKDNSYTSYAFIKIRTALHG